MMTNSNRPHSTEVEQFSLNSTVWKGITLTSSAIKQVNSITGADKFLRIAVKASGCTGYAYTLNLIDSPSEEDIAFTSGNTTVYVPLKSMPFLDGTEIDFVKQGLNQSFTYKNPNVKSVCGCGESFGV